MHRGKQQHKDESCEHGTRRQTRCKKNDNAGFKKTQPPTKCTHDVGNNSMVVNQTKDREGDSVCVCVCVRERERERRGGNPKDGHIPAKSKNGIVPLPKPSVRDNAANFRLAASLHDNTAAFDAALHPRVEIVFVDRGLHIGRIGEIVVHVLTRDIRGNALLALGPSEALDLWNGDFVFAVFVFAVFVTTVQARLGLTLTGSSWAPSRRTGTDGTFVTRRTTVPSASPRWRGGCGRRVVLGLGRTEESKFEDGRFLGWNRRRVPGLQSLEVCVCVCVCVCH